MHMRRMFFMASCVSLAALQLGIAAALWGGGSGALLTVELAFFQGVAILIGFASATPSLRPWLKCRPIQGAALITLAVAVVYTPITHIISAILFGLGVHKLWQSACAQPSNKTSALDVTIVTPDDKEIDGDGPPCSLTHLAGSASRALANARDVWGK